MKTDTRARRRALLATAAAPAIALALIATSVQAQQAQKTFSIAPQPLADALLQLSRQADVDIVASTDLTRGHTAPKVQGEMTTADAMSALLAGSGLVAAPSGAGYVITKAADPQSGSAAGDGADGTVAALVVTAQKREEQIQDVPIAISAFTEKTLQEQKIEGGFDLLKAIPNVTFSKNNFTSYNFSIRGIGTKAVSATTDPGVAVSFNNIALLQNRLFEQEYFDVERVEVLRGPQGTLYGRNATAGVINVISAKPNLHEFSGWLKGEVGNYNTKRVSAMVNVPIMEDKLAVRLAGSLTNRDGFDFNTGTNHNVNGRDLWSARATVQFNPTDKFRSNLVWERFNENDNRSRTGKQLCYRDPGLTEVKGTPVLWPSGSIQGDLNPLWQSMFSQGCKPGSLYDPQAFGTPNGLALPFVWSMLWLRNQFGLGNQTALIGLKDPYGGMMQSPDLRVIDSFKDPVYRAKADVVELNLDYDLTNDLTIFSQTAYNKDQTYSFQDYNRFNTVPIFTDTASAPGIAPAFRNLAPGGIFCDPQLGCSKSIAGFDIASAKGTQFTQEFRLQSNYDGAVNFSAGVNYTHFKTLVDYYVMYNLITAFAEIFPFNSPPYFGDASDITTCYMGVAVFPIDPVPRGTLGSGCPYIDPNPVESINGEGHNYFRSKNPYKVASAAAFGELYWKINPDLKLTAGLRYTDDRKTFIPVPTQVLLSQGIVGGGTVNRGYPELPAIKQHWGEWTGRLGVDWKPDLSFTDQTLLYAFYSHGYKAGGANPPTPGFATTSYCTWYNQALPDYTCPVGNLSRFTDQPVMFLPGVDYGPTFAPEFVDALEFGSKNTLLDGALTLNGTAFYYNYKDYQVSQIKDRTAVNENFDARIWGLELESMFAPTRDLQFVANIGYLNTRIGDGETSIDIMNRTQGNPDFVVVKPWVQLPSNCVVPAQIVQLYLTDPQTHQTYPQVFGQFCGGTNNFYDGSGELVTHDGVGPFIIDPNTGERYTPVYYNGQNGTVNINGGAGIKADLGGNELPNAPHFTVNLGAQYAIHFGETWKVTARGDAYWQSQSWARVYNDDPYDKLHGWFNMNLSVWAENEDGLKIEFYAKNILNKTPITDAFLNSDDTGLTTNVFTLDPRLLGLSIRKEF